MQIEIKFLGIDGMYVKTVGRLDLDTAVEYGTKIKDAVEDNNIKELVLDFTEITFISSFGLKIILELFNNMKAINGKLKLKGVSEQIQNTFKMVGFDKFLDIE
ncbi:MAG: STAS domain-containing protein [bacterium]|nr:STAS domain-containing protein [bacterium]